MLDQKALLERIVRDHDGECILFDTETTGLGKTDLPIQIAAYRLSIDPDLCTADIKESVNWFIRPPFMVSSFIEQFTGITNRFLRTCPEADDVIDDIKRFFEDIPVIGYNVVFDNGMMSRLYDWTGNDWTPVLSADVLCMAREFLVKGRDVPDHKQETLARYYGVDQGLQFHDARGDIEACRRLLETFMRLYQKKTQSGI